eukprot:3666033-Prorocentrum_lima.AAC.1
MTSSLVGSEMCIRDRFSWIWKASSRVSLGRQRSTSEAADWQAQEGHTPVSYTHLTLPTICSV